MNTKLSIASLYILLFLFAAGCHTQNKNTAAKKQEIGDVYSWDFGQVKEGEVLKHDFIFKNTSGDTINIKDINTSCGCTVSKVEKKTLAPGESTVIEAQYNTKGYSGAVQQYVYMRIDKPDAATTASVNGTVLLAVDNPIIQFIIKANVVKGK